MTVPRLILAPLDTRIRLAGLWTTTMFIVAFVDIFLYFRADLRAQVEAGRASVFEIGQPFMLGIIVYVTIPTLMIALSLVLPYRANRLANLVVASLFALTIIGAAIGEWAYYLAASAVEIVLLTLIVTLAAKWKVPASQLISRTPADSAV